MAISIVKYVKLDFLNSLLPPPPTYPPPTLLRSLAPYSLPCLNVGAVKLYWGGGGCFS